MPAGPTSATSASAGWIRRRSRPRNTGRRAAGASGATPTEFHLFTDHPVIDFMPDQRELEDKGGTMRLGLYPAKLTPGSKAAEAYGAEVIYERHRHRFEVNNQYRERLEGAGMLLSGQSPDGRLVEIVELPGHPWSGA